jgi:hypothetical protein
MYTLGDLINASGVAFDTSGALNVPGNHVGNLRDVFVAWGGQLGQILYWDNGIKSVSFASAGVSAAQIQSVVNSFRTQKCVTRISISSSVRDSFSNGVVASFQPEKPVIDSESSGTNGDDKGFTKAAHLLDTRRIVTKDLVEDLSEEFAAALLIKAGIAKPDAFDLLVIGKSIAGEGNSGLYARLGFDYQAWSNPSPKKGEGLASPVDFTINEDDKKVLKAHFKAAGVRDFSDTDYGKMAVIRNSQNSAALPSKTI